MRDPRILLVRPDHLGDVLLTLPAAAALKRSVPSARLTYLVNSGLESVPGKSPAVDQTLSLPFPPPDASIEPFRWEVGESAVSLLRDRFDIAVLLRPRDRWSGWLVEAAGIPARIGFAGDGMERFLTDAIPETHRRHAVLLAHDVLTEAFHGMDGSAPHGSPPATPSPGDRVFVPSRADQRETEEAIEPLEAITGRTPLILHPGTGWQLKNWPPERWGRVAFELHRRFGTGPVITGSGGEQHLVEEVVAHSAGSAVGLWPPLSLGGFAALLSKAALVVASDSGPLHLAAIVGTPVVGLYGPGDPAVVAPWSPSESQRIVRIDLPCSPCGVMHDPPCGAHRDPACVTGVHVEGVVEAAESVRAGVP